jgi:uncharacterized protein (TIGR02172 family)
MNKLEEAIIYATIMHQGKVRKFSGTPYILHPLEVAQILSTMTDDEEVITAGILHDIVEDTDGTLSEINRRFGKRVAFLVSCESENEYPGEAPGATWQRRKEASLLVLKNSTDIGVRMIWLADKLSNIRSLSGLYSERGETMWSGLHQSDPAMQRWYYRSVAEQVELFLNKTGAFKEFIKHINFIWPGTFDSDKARYRKYRDVSVDGCKLLGRGAKGDVYLYDDELVIKVYNERNTYHDVEREISLSRKAFILGIPTAISFGIVSVGNRYGAMYELLDSVPLSRYIAMNPGQVKEYAKMMAELAHTIHSVEVSENDGFPDASERLRSYITSGIAYENETLTRDWLRLLDAMPPSRTLIHGDFHTGNVFLQRGEPILVDLDRLSTGHPIMEISDVCYYYQVLGEEDPAQIENFMGFSYETAQRFFRFFLMYYLDTEDENRIREVTEIATLICYVRLVHKIHRKEMLTEKDRDLIRRCLVKIENGLKNLTAISL